MSGARAAAVVAGTVASVGLALMSEQGRLGGSRLAPAMAEAAPSAPVATPSTHGLLSASRQAVARNIGHATLLGLIVLTLAALVPTATALASSLRGSSPAASAESYGPPAELRAASVAGAGWEAAYAAAVPSASDRGAALIAGAAEKRTIDTLIALDAWAKREEAAKRAELQAASAPSVPVRGTVQSLNSVSGHAPGTVVRARITIYGCTGRGGGFCGGMSSGITVFEGAAACSNDMRFGTRFTIDGDPTGRTYECLDRGHLSAPWVDVFFYNTEAGIAWAGQLGSTHANIRIVN